MAHGPFRLHRDVVRRLSHDDMQHSQWLNRVPIFVQGEKQQGSSPNFQRRPAISSVRQKRSSNWFHGMLFRLLEIEGFPQYVQFLSALASSIESKISFVETVVCHQKLRCEGITATYSEGETNSISKMMKCSIVPKCYYYSTTECGFGQTFWTSDKRWREVRDSCKKASGNGCISLERTKRTDRKLA